jgi:hypothetical protein
MTSVLSKADDVFCVWSVWSVRLQLISGMFGYPSEGILYHMGMGSCKSPFLSRGLLSLVDMKRGAILWNGFRVV